MSHFEEVKQIINKIATEAVILCPDTPNEDYYARQICQLFEKINKYDVSVSGVTVPSDESRLLTDKEQCAHWEWVDEGDGYNQQQDWNIKTLLEAQDAKTSRIKDAECRARVARIFEDIEKEFAHTHCADKEDGYEQYFIGVKKWQTLKKQEVTE